MKIDVMMFKYLSPERVFMISTLLVNAGNYLYNLGLGRILGPKEFADAAILITFLLVLSFIAMTFQLVTAKYVVIFDHEVFKSFIGFISKHAIIVGVLIGISIIVFSKHLQLIFNTSSSKMFVIFGIGVPIYFLMSINRGVFQGQKEFDQLSITYQSEMLSRLIITLILLYTLQVQSSVLVSAGILISFVFGLIPFKMKKDSFTDSPLEAGERKLVLKFIVLTAFYEFTQIIINNSDILLVKHYFENYEAGLYASLALIGRVVYFVAWMFVMILLPTVVKLHKEGKKHTAVMLKYVLYISALSAIIVFVTFLFPEFVIKTMFGEAYLSVSPLLWKYALATSIFAISNVFAYYFLSLDQYIPVILSGLTGLGQIVLIIFFHESLEQVVVMQIIAMAVLFIVQLVFFALYILKNRLNMHS
ncbi:oligosaccharide flippase family protein [Abyssalbus ytuae]|uniref:Oligosaccharide flippase family protein n=1 Tax=Abyssalbus ytuae TaxID=2926907 RepID=A0A9E6ZR72_9FLAO|nr:oligosaccharide flippase family protein [Abyssalbus ytuae]UOB19065.1 oligosaccharide flippase family protein [Abyssalbus ytuae]